MFTNPASLTGLRARRGAFFVVGGAGIAGEWWREMRGTCSRKSRRTGLRGAMGGATPRGIYLMCVYHILWRPGPGASRRHDGLCITEQAHGQAFTRKRRGNESPQRGRCNIRRGCQPPFHGTIPLLHSNPQRGWHIHPTGRGRHIIMSPPTGGSNVVAAHCLYTGVDTPA